MKTYNIKAKEAVSRQNFEAVFYFPYKIVIKKVGFKVAFTPLSFLGCVQERVV
ncbi:hypothetical protein [Chryseobacterium taklimakanense]|uniref:hypothetical protein n=1 Tax=Chryseobacterium taklimakanense TaxID=536441 RepID=UPI0013DDF23E|nr:hypothetical protein [Chryseobacterium taklimakanense]